MAVNKPPALKPELVMEFVAKAHADFQRVRELLQQEPALVNASWDSASTQKSRGAS